MSGRDYRYPPDFTVLRNRLDIRDAPALEAAERQLVARRLLEPVPAGDFDLARPKAIHLHPFQDVYNHVHPFREGNGRTQLQYPKQLAGHAGHAIDLTRIDRDDWFDASRRSNAGDRAAMTRCIRQALADDTLRP